MISYSEHRSRQRCAPLRSSNTGTVSAALTLPTAQRPAPRERTATTEQRSHERAPPSATSHGPLTTNLAKTISRLPLTVSASYRPNESRTGNKRFLTSLTDSNTEVCQITSPIYRTRPTASGGCCRLSVVERNLPWVGPPIELSSDLCSNAESIHMRNTSNVGDQRL